MAGGMEVDPAAIQAFATFLADAKSQLEQVKAQFDAPNAAAEHFGRSWKAEGDQYVDDWGKLAPDLGNLSTLLDQVAAQLTAGAELTVAGETAAVGEFTKIAASGDTEAPASESGGI
ncbi:hypothetical protein [Actinophytocola sp.]|uniref:hypothetical protein n=1 Tax=Actinophytocola sp. TaxID=1872138 RepID=UPI002ED00EF8